MSITTINQQLKSSHERGELTTFLGELKWDIGTFGGRKLVHKDQTIQGSLCLNEIIQKVDAAALKQNSQSVDGKDPGTLIRKIEKLDSDGDAELALKFCLLRLLTAVRRLIGNWGYSRKEALETIKNACAATIKPLEIPIKPQEVPKPEPEPVDPPELIEGLKSYCKKGAYIHGTSSVIFALLAQTEHKLVSIWDLLQKKVAPIGGEIILGGLNLPMPDGPTYFGRLQGSCYPLSRVLSGYARSPAKLDIENTLENKKQLLADMLGALGHCYLTQSLVFATRAKQRGIDLLFDDQIKNELPSAISNMRSYFLINYQLILFIAKFVKPTDEKAEADKTDDASKREKAGYDFMKKFNEFLLQDEFVKEDFELSKFIQLNQLPKNDKYLEQIRSFLKENGYRLLDQASTDTTVKPGDSQIYPELFSDIYYNVSNCYNMQSVALQNPHQILHLWPQVQERFFQYLDKAVLHFDLLREMLFGKENRQLTEEQLDYLKEPFPVIFISNQNEHFRLNKGREYVSNSSLQLGVEIKYIATERKRIEQVKKYLTQHNIHNVTVVAIDALKKHTENN